MVEVAALGLGAGPLAWWGWGPRERRAQIRRWLTWVRPMPNWGPLSPGHPISANPSRSC